MDESEGTRSVVDVARLRAAVRRTARSASHGGLAGARFRGGRAEPAGRLPGRRHARSGRVVVLLRAVAPVVLAVGGLGAAVLLGIRWAEATAPPPPREVLSPPVRPSAAPAGLTPIPPPARAETDAMLRDAGGPGEADWAEVLRALDRRRASAFASGEAARLAGVYVPGSASWREDVADLTELRAAGLRARGLRLVPTSVAVHQVGAGSVVLDVVDRMPSYEIVDGTGRVVRRDPGRGDRKWRVTVVPAQASESVAGNGGPVDGAGDATGGWRIAQVVTGAG